MPGTECPRGHPCPDLWLPTTQGTSDYPVVGMDWYPQPSSLLGPFPGQLYPLPLPKLSFLSLESLLQQGKENSQSDQGVTSGLSSLTEVTVS